MTTGRFIWYELMTSDVAAAKAFYASVVGWTAQDSQQPGMDYHMWMADGVGIGGVMQLPDMAAKSGMSSSWLGYISVADIDEAAAALTADGGGKYMDQTIPGVGRFATVSDPQGAPFYVMVPDGAEGTSRAFELGTPGHIGWNEYHGKDGAAAADFYTKHFGWTRDEPMDMGEMGKYHLFSINGVQAGGLMANTQVPRPHWMFYFNIEDISAAKARVEAGEGKIYHGPVQVPGGQWVVNCGDPQGAMFSLVGPKA